MRWVRVYSRKPPVLIWAIAYHVFFLNVQSGHRSEKTLLFGTSMIEDLTDEEVWISQSCLCNAELQLSPDQLDLAERHLGGQLTVLCESWLQQAEKPRVAARIVSRASGARSSPEHESGELYARKTAGKHSDSGKFSNGLNTGTKRELSE
jgi:hypothetical protein